MNYAVLALALLVLVLLVQLLRIRHRQEALRLDIHRFLSHPTAPKYSVRDDAFAALENAVADLKQQLLQEQAGNALRSKQNADFVADISHQLKTPLAALRLYCELDEGACPGSHAHKELVQIQRMETLIHALLRLENLRADAYTMQFEPHSLRELTKDIAQELEALFPHKRFVLEGDATLRCDRSWLREALLNIMKNACEHTPEDGFVQVHIRQGERSVSLSVEDNGGGLPQEELPKLFTRFFHSANSHKHSAGIGLAITKEIVTKHHGTIYAENTPQGLRILLCLPVLDGVQSYESVSGASRSRKIPVLQWDARRDET